MEDQKKGGQTDKSGDSKQGSTQKKDESTKNAQ